MSWKVLGDGNGTFRGAHSCRVVFYAENTATGEKKRLEKTFRVEKQTKREKARCIREYRAELESGPDYDKRNVLFSDYASEWLDARRADPALASSTVSKDETRVRTLCLTFGNMRVSAITRADVRKWQTAIMTADENGNAPTLGGKPVTGTTANGYRVTLRQIMQEAFEDEITARNPCDGVKAPTVDTPEKEALTIAEAKRAQTILDSGEPTPTRTGLRLCLFAGLRRSEAVAVRWKDFDSDKGTLAVTRSFDLKGRKFKEPKTKNGVRVVKLDAATVAYLERFRRQQERLLFGTGSTLDDACICATVGTDYMHPANLARAVKLFGRRNGFGEITPHILRHTYCTLLFAAGADLPTVQYLMGHKDPATTLRIYTHYLETSGERAAADLGTLMDSAQTATVTAIETGETKHSIANQLPKRDSGTKKDVRTA